MKRLDVQELREHIDEILHMLDESETYEVTEQGRVIAHVVIEPRQQIKRDSSEAWKNLTRLSAELSARWPANVSAVDAIRDVRQ